MTRAGRFLRNLIEKFLGRYYEGASTPPRIGEEWRVWLALHPDADRHVIEGYVGLLLEAAYRDGFTRGYEWQERGWEGPAVEPERLVEAAEHDWSLADSNPRVRHLLEDGFDPADPLANVAAPDRRRFYDVLAQAQDIHAFPQDVVWDEEEPAGAGPHARIWVGSSLGGGKEEGSDE